MKAHRSSKHHERSDQDAERGGELSLDLLKKKKGRKRSDQQRSRK